MTVKELADSLNLTNFAMPDPDREITGGYTGDLLSWVMGRAKGGDAWVTIMSNPNVAAVAALTDVACVILSENVQPDADLLKKAEAQGINLLGTTESSYAICGALRNAI